MSSPSSRPRYPISYAERARYFCPRENMLIMPPLPERYVTRHTAIIFAAPLSTYAMRVLFFRA